MMHRRAHNIRINASLHLIKESKQRLRFFFLANLCLFSCFFFALLLVFTTRSRLVCVDTRFLRMRYFTHIDDIYATVENVQKKNCCQIAGAPQRYDVMRINGYTISSLASTTENVRIARKVLENLHYISFIDNMSSQYMRA